MLHSVAQLKDYCLLFDEWLIADRTPFNIFFVLQQKKVHWHWIWESSSFQDSHQTLQFTLKVSIIFT